MLRLTPDGRHYPGFSVFRLDGTPISPPQGFTQGNITSPQGTVSDRRGNIWIANACSGTVTHDRGGNPNDFWIHDMNASVGEGARPFDIAIDHDGNAWLNDITLTNPGGDGIVVFIGLAGPVEMPLVGPPRQP